MLRSKNYPIINGSFGRPLMGVGDVSCGP
jgi:hypothetical protein